MSASPTPSPETARSSSSGSPMDSASPASSAASSTTPPAQANLGVRLPTRTSASTPSSAFSNAQLRARVSGSPIYQPAATASQQSQHASGHSPTPSPRNGSVYTRESLQAPTLSIGTRILNALTPRNQPPEYKRKSSTASVLPLGTPRAPSLPWRQAASCVSSRSSLLPGLLFFIAGMAFTYILFSTLHLTPSNSVPSTPALMYWFQRGPSSHPDAIAKEDAIAQAATSPAATSEVSATPSVPLLPLCGQNGHADGFWEFDPSITKAPYKSNEWDNKCDEEGYTNDGSPALPGPKGLREEVRYVWRSRTCRMVPYSRPNFCRLLAGRNILFVGDSIAGQHLLSFVHQMHSEPDNLWIRDEYYRYDVMSVCQDFYPVPTDPTVVPRAGVHPLTGKPLPGLRVGFKRNNFIHPHTDAELADGVEYRKWNTNQTWINYIEEHKYDIVVINTGIWMIDAPAYTKILRDTEQLLRTRYPKVQVVWRSTQPGHASCHTHWARPQARLYDIRDTTGGSEKFRWNEADERNRIAREIFPNSFLDVATQTKLRPDGHMPGECLHYCQPGPIDAWQQVLYHHIALGNPKFIEKLDREAAAAAAPEVALPMLQGLELQARTPSAPSTS